MRCQGKEVVLAAISGLGVKSLIFATLYKPAIVLEGATINKIKIVRNAEHCLIYDREIGPDNLLWSELAAWWKEEGRP